jgi:hypothetical protein
MVDVVDKLEIVWCVALRQWLRLRFNHAVHRAPSRLPPSISLTRSNTQEISDFKRFSMRIDTFDVIYIILVIVGAVLTEIRTSTAQKRF